MEYKDSNQANAADAEEGAEEDIELELFAPEDDPYLCYTVDVLQNLRVRILNKTINDRGNSHNSSSPISLPEIQPGSSKTNFRTGRVGSSRRRSPTFLKRRNIRTAGIVILLQSNLVHVDGMVGW